MDRVGVDVDRLPARVDDRGDAAFAVSPFATPGALRVSTDVFDADDPAAALAARFLLRYPAGTRSVYATDLAEWFGFCDRLGTAPLQARLDHADAYGRYLAEVPRRNGRPLGASIVQRKLSAASSFYRYLVGIRVLTDSPFLGVARPAVSTDSPTTGLDVAEMRRLRAAAAGDGPRSEALTRCCSTTGCASARHSAGTSSTWATTAATASCASTARAGRSPVLPWRRRRPTPWTPTSVAARPDRSSSLPAAGEGPPRQLPVARVVAGEEDS
jgi:hypothetical protein